MYRRDIVTVRIRPLDKVKVFEAHRSRGGIEPAEGLVVIVEHLFLRL